jgi:hypothetical protein
VQTKRNETKRNSLLAPAQAGSGSGSAGVRFHRRVVGLDWVGGEGRGRGSDVCVGKLGRAWDCFGQAGLFFMDRFFFRSPFLSRDMTSGRKVREREWFPSGAPVRFRDNRDWRIRDDLLLRLCWAHIHRLGIREVRIFRHLCILWMDLMHIVVIWSPATDTCVFIDRRPDFSFSDGSAGAIRMWKALSFRGNA